MIPDPAIPPVSSRTWGNTLRQTLLRQILFFGLCVYGFLFGLASTSPAQEASPTRWIGVVLPLQAIDVAAETGGRLEELPVRAGDEVEAGELLAQLETEDTLQSLKVAEAEMKMAKAEYDHALVQAQREEAGYERRSDSAELWSEEELASSDFDVQGTAAEARARGAAFEMATAAVEQLRHSLEYLVVRAPFTGHVSIRYLDPGSVVSTGTPIVRLVSGAARLVRFAVPAEQISQLGLGTQVEVFGTDERLLGYASVRHISPEIDLAAQRIFVEAILEDSSLGFEPRGGLGVEVHPRQESIE